MLLYVYATGTGGTTPAAGSVIYYYTAGGTSVAETWFSDTACTTASAAQPTSVSVITACLSYSVNGTVRGYTSASVVSTPPSLAVGQIAKG